MSALAASIEAQSDLPRTARRVEPAQRLHSDAEVLEAAQRVAKSLAEGAAARDSQRLLPERELDQVSGAGLWAMNLPRAHGGAAVSYATVARVFAILSAADASILSLIHI